MNSHIITRDNFRGWQQFQRYIISNRLLCSYRNSTLLLFLMGTLVNILDSMLSCDWTHTQYHTSFNSQYKSLSDLPVDVWCLRPLLDLPYFWCLRPLLDLPYFWCLRPLLHPGGQGSTLHRLVHMPDEDLVGPMDNRTVEQSWLIEHIHA